MPVKTEYEFGDDVELVEDKDFPGFKYPKALQARISSGALKSGSESTKRRIAAALVEANGDDTFQNADGKVDVDRMSATEFGEYIAGIMKAKKAVIEPPEKKATGDELRKQVEAAIRGELDSSYKKKERDLQNQFKLNVERAKLSAMLSPTIQPEWSQHIGDMVDKVAIMELDGESIVYRAKSDPDKHLYSGDKPAIADDIVKMIQKQYPSAFKITIPGPGTSAKNGTGGKFEQEVDWSKMTSSQIAQFVK